jgi:hypothetical protein
MKRSVDKIGIIERERYLSILNKIFRLLKVSNLPQQTDVIDRIIKLIDIENINEFVELINGVEFWGGVGAVWEVYIEDKKNAEKFEAEIINLIDLMQETNILGRGIKPIRKIFLNNLRQHSSN